VPISSGVSGDSTKAMLVPLGDQCGTSALQYEPTGQLNTRRTELPSLFIVSRAAAGDTGNAGDTVGSDLLVERENAIE
jgi:hypothetical protein